MSASMLEEEGEEEGKEALVGLVTEREGMIVVVIGAASEVAPIGAG